MNTESQVAKEQHQQLQEPLLGGLPEATVSTVDEVEQNDRRRGAWVDLGGGRGGRRKVDIHRQEPVVEGGVTSPPFKASGCGAGGSVDELHRQHDNFHRVPCEAFMPFDGYVQVAPDSGKWYGGVCWIVGHSHNQNNNNNNDDDDDHNNNNVNIVDDGSNNDDENTNTTTHDDVDHHASNNPINDADDALTIAQVKAMSSEWENYVHLASNRSRCCNVMLQRWPFLLLFVVLYPISTAFLCRQYGTYTQYFEDGTVIQVQLPVCQYFGLAGRIACVILIVLIGLYWYVKFGPMSQIREQEIEQQLEEFVRAMNHDGNLDDLEMVEESGDSSAAYNNPSTVVDDPVEMLRRNYRLVYKRGGYQQTTTASYGYVFFVRRRPRVVDRSTFLENITTYCSGTIEHGVPGDMNSRREPTTATSRLHKQELDATAHLTVGIVHIDAELLNVLEVLPQEQPQQQQQQQQQQHDDGNGDLDGRNGYFEPYLHDLMILKLFADRIAEAITLICLLAYAWGWAKVGNFSARQMLPLSMVYIWFTSTLFKHAIRRYLWVKPYINLAYVVKERLLYMTMQQQCCCGNGNVTTRRRRPPTNILTSMYDFHVIFSGTLGISHHVVRITRIPPTVPAATESDMIPLTPSAERRDVLTYWNESIRRHPKFDAPHRHGGGDGRHHQSIGLLRHIFCLDRQSMDKDFDELSKIGNKNNNSD
mmetsp:Transcript_39357/g.95194  ORF Transcript_39357/g.95194 Transcript_39357/m.95194 type:complete len:703 (-) Transcript_39357:191-2299(-)